MQQLKAYQQKSLSGGWTRIEMLLMLYDRALSTLECCEIAAEANDQAARIKHELAFRKTIIAIHAGLKPEECEVAFNILRLLDYTLYAFDQKQFGSCRKVLGNIRDGFAQIADEANRLESEGEIPPLPDSDAFESLA